jgi:DNA-binding IclR family transcriptional regulator
MFNDTEVVIVDFVRNGVSGLEIGLSPGARFPLNALAQGKIALPYGPRQSPKNLRVAAGRAHVTHRHRSGPEDRSNLRRGWTDGPEELFRGINGLAVPIFSPDRSLAV